MSSLNIILHFDRPNKDQLDSDPADLSITVNPFEGTEKGKVPTFMKPALQGILRNGTTISSPKGDIPFSGKQLSRDIQLHGLVQQLEILQTVAESTEAKVSIHVSSCGRMGNHLLKILLSHLTDSTFEFVGFPENWARKIQKMELLEELEYYNYVAPRNIEEKTISSIKFQSKKLVTATTTTEPKVVVEEKAPSKKKKTSPKIVDVVEEKILKELKDSIETENTETKVEDGTSTKKNGRPKKKEVSSTEIVEETSTDVKEDK